MSWLFNNEYPYTDFHELNLSWLIEKYKFILDALQKIDGWIEQHQEEYEELKSYYDMLVSGNFPPEITKAFEKWMKANALDLVGELVQMVIFNITDDGYFVAYIPESWDEIIFNTTGLDIDLPLQPEYGHLVLSYAGNTRAY